jgi:hypothetical protein
MVYNKGSDWGEGGLYYQCKLTKILTLHYQQTLDFDDLKIVKKDL